MQAVSRLIWTYATAPGCRLGTASAAAAVTTLAAAAAVWGQSTGHPRFRVLRMLFTLVVAAVLSYAGHRWIVHDKQLPFLWKLHNMHHTQGAFPPSRTDVIREGLVDLLVGGVIIIPLAVSGMLDLPTVIFFMVAYVTGHMITYHDGGPGGIVHRKHHERTDTNFSPYVLDVLFGTHVPGCMELTDPLIPNVMVALAAALTCYGLMMVWQ